MAPADLQAGHLFLTACYATHPCSQFGPLESIRVFPGKTFAFVNFANAVDAIRAKSALDAQVCGACCRVSTLCSADVHVSAQQQMLCLVSHVAL